MNTDLSRIDTEQRNPATAHIDTLSTLEMAELINQEDHRCAEAVKAVLPEIARASSPAAPMPSSGRWNTRRITRIWAGRIWQAMIFPPGMC